MLENNNKKWPGDMLHRHLSAKFWLYCLTLSRKPGFLQIDHGRMDRWMDGCAVAQGTSLKKPFTFLRFFFRFRLCGTIWESIFPVTDEMFKLHMNFLHSGRFSMSET